MRTSQDQSIWQKTLNVACALAWAVNIVILLATCLWIANDGRSPPTPSDLWERAGINSQLGLVATTNRHDWLGIRSGVLIGGLSYLLILLSVVCGPHRFRSLQKWLLAIGLASCWCGLFASWSELYWKGQQTRLAKTLPQAERFVEALQVDWPAEEGNLQGIGAFLAYPKPQPTTLLILGESTVPGTLLSFSAIERTADDSLKLELAGAETGAWLEWRPDGSSPKSFIGGLQTTYSIVKCVKLAKAWNVVRYETSTQPQSPKL